MRFATSQIKREVESRLDVSSFYRTMSPEEAARISEALLDALKVFDEICRENGLQYMLVAGSLIGAVRDGRLLPWDDDIDIVLPRKDYWAFKKALERSKYAGVYRIKYPEDNSVITMGAHFYSTQVDLHKLIGDEIGDSNIYEAIAYLDILPIDYCSESALWDKIRGIIVNALQRGYISQRCFKKNDPYINYLAKYSWELRINLWIRELFALPFLLIGKRGVFKLLDRILSNVNESDSITVAYGALQYFGEKTPASIWLPVKDIELSGFKVMAPNQPEAYLEHRYGDYLTPPSKEEQKRIMRKLKRDWESRKQENCK